MICHFCFTVDVSSSVIGQSGSEDIKPASISTGQLLSNLVSVFNPLSNSSQDQANAELTANGMCGKFSKVLFNLPSIEYISKGLLKELYSAKKHQMSNISMQ